MFLLLYGICILECCWFFFFLLVQLCFSNVLSYLSVNLFFPRDVGYCLATCMWEGQLWAQRTRSRVRKWTGHNIVNHSQLPSLHHVGPQVTPLWREKQHLRERMMPCLSRSFSACLVGREPVWCELGFLICHPAQPHLYSPQSSCSFLNIPHPFPLFCPWSNFLWQTSTYALQLSSSAPLPPHQVSSDLPDNNPRNWCVLSSCSGLGLLLNTFHAFPIYFLPQSWHREVKWLAEGVSAS